ncbi:hypothetical protein AB0D59_03550 [Streptomyces sp. NPDC048417]|uniref:hypothetical protein n=1 Tax=Streptomyces sp. NPDC048417 TaxID=3155387 RepID=UPI00343EE6EF
MHLPCFPQDDLRADLDFAAKVREVADRIDAAPAQVTLTRFVAQGPHVVAIPAPVGAAHVVGLEQAGTASRRPASDDAGPVSSNQWISRTGRPHLTVPAVSGSEVRIRASCGSFSGHGATRGERWGGGVPHPASRNLDRRQRLDRELGGPGLGRGRS